MYNLTFSGTRTIQPTPARNAVISGSATHFGKTTQPEPQSDLDDRIFDLVSGRDGKKYKQLNYWA